MNKNLMPTWHKGELAVQKRAGTDNKMAEIGPKFVREFMPQQHREFFQSLDMIYIGYSDQNNQSYSSVLFGAPGFIYSPTESELVINTQHTMGDDIKYSLNVGDRIGLIGIVFESKRRNRINAIITDVNQINIKLKILQSFGNCPQYIQPKSFVSNNNYGSFKRTVAKHLNQDDRQIITNADTFFIASTFDDGKHFNNRGTDMSHRGGSAGFITITEAGELTVPDYAGNGFFNTLGNLTLNPIASLLFFDWQQGHVLQLTVSSHIDWHNNKQAASSSEQRTLYFTPIKIERISNGLAYRQLK